MKFKEMRLPARATVWYTASVLIGRGVGFLFTPIFTRLLSPAAYGIYNLYASWLGIFTIISTFEVGGAVFMRQMQRYGDREKLLRSACLLEALLIGAVCTLYFTFFAFVSRLTELGVFMSLAMFLQIFLNSVINLYLAFSKFRYGYASVFAINVITGCLPTVLAIILIKVFAVRVYAKILSQLAVSLAVFCVLIYIIFKKEKSISFKMAAKLFRSAALYFPHYISIALISRVDKLFVASAYGEATLAKYAIADTIGSLLIFTASAPLSALTPWILRRISADELSPVRRVLTVCTRIILWLTAALLGFAPEIIGFLAPPSYAEALFAAYPIAVSAIPYFAFAITSAALTHGGGALGALPSVIGGGASFLLSYILSRLPHFSYVSFALPISYLIMLTVGVFIAERRGISRIINLRGTVSDTLFCAGLALVLFILRDSLALRLGAILLFTVPLIFDLGRGLTLVREN